MHSLHYCPLSMEFNPHVTHVILQIYETTTKKEFDHLRLVEYSSFNFNNVTQYGTNVMERAIQVGNIELVKYFCTINDGELLNKITRLSKSPLLHATLCKDPQKGSLMAIELLNAGAHVNSLPDPDISPSHVPGMGKRPSDADADRATPLWGAIERSRNFDLIRLFLAKGGVIFPALSSEGIKTLASCLPSPIILLCAKNDNDWMLATNILREIIEKIVRLVPALIICDTSSLAPKSNLVITYSHLRI